MTVEFGARNNLRVEGLTSGRSNSPGIYILDEVGCQEETESVAAK